MAKYCAKCGKVLPDGVEICPDCHVAATEDGAALFTRMTAETEVWKTPAEAKKKERPKRTQIQKQTLAYVIAAVAIVVVAVCLILYVQPANRVARALRAGQYDRAMELYWSEKSLASGAHDEQIGREVLRSAERVLDAFANHEMGAEEAASALSRMGTLGGNAEALLADVIEDFRALSASQDHMAHAERLSLNGDYLAAREEYLLVIESDAFYPEAQEMAAACLDRYADSVLNIANVYIQSGDYAAAIQELESGEQTLLGYDVYNEKIDFKLDATYTLFEEYLLTEAGNLAAKEDYSGAVDLLRKNMERFDYETTALTAAVDRYLELAKNKTLADASDEADRLYAARRYTDAFALLDETRTAPGVVTEDADTVIAALEARFAEDQIAAAEKLFNGNRDKLPTAVELIKAALKIRDLEELQTYLDDISHYLPVSLAELKYDPDTRKGTILRSTSEFEGLDGTVYTGGWIWGESGAELTFQMDGNYDLLEGTLAVRRDEEVSASGHFEVYCDGKLVYESETLHHQDIKPLDISVDISGCDALTLRFITDYPVRTADNGYCYHGFCNPTITRSLDARDAAPGTENEEETEAEEETEEETEETEDEE